MHDLKHKCLSSCITRCPLRLFCVSLLWTYFMSHFSGLMRYHSVLSSWHIFSNTCRLIHLPSILIFPFSKPPPPFILLLFIYSFCNSILTLVIYTFTEALINILKCGVAVVDASMVVFCPHLVVVGIDRNYTSSWEQARWGNIKETGEWNLKNYWEAIHRAPGASGLNRDKRINRMTSILNLQVRCRSVYRTPVVKLICTLRDPWLVP